MLSYDQQLLLLQTLVLVLPLLVRVTEEVAHEGWVLEEEGDLHCFLVLDLVHSVGSMWDQTRVFCGPLTDLNFVRLLLV